MIDESHLKQLLRFHDRIQFRFIIANYSIAVSRMTVFWTALFPILCLLNISSTKSAAIISIGEKLAPSLLCVYVIF